MNKLFALLVIEIQMSVLNIQCKQFIGSLILIISLLPIAYFDLKTRYIPDRYMLITGTIALVLRLSSKSAKPAAWPGSLGAPLLAAIITALPFIILYLLRDDIGGADAKLAAICGCYAGVEYGLRILLLGCAISMLPFSLHHFVSAHRKPGKTVALPFHYPLLPGICLALSLAALRFPPLSY